MNTCCQEAVDLLGRLGFITTIDRKRISYLNIHFCNANRFPHPNPYVANGIKPKPPLFEYFPQAAADASSFILGHFDHFSVEMLRNEIITNIILGLVRESEQDGGGILEDSEELILFSHYTIKPQSNTKVLRWVHYLGFKQDKMKKSYYINGHEHKDQKRHRSKFTKKYLTQLEPRSHRWVQMSTEKAELMKPSLPANNLLLSTGHIYVDPDTGVDHVEFHVDNHHCIQDFANTPYGVIGGNVSVRKSADQKPLIVFGQDTSIFNQFLFGLSQWVGRPIW